MESTLNTTGTDVVLSEVVSATGCMVRTADGREYLDAESGVWCVGLGHQHPAVTAAITRQLAAVGHVGYRYTAPVVERAARRLCEITGLAGGRALLLSSGSEAVELGVRIAATVTGRAQFLRQARHYLSAFGTAGVPADGRWLTTDDLAGLDDAELAALLDDVAGIVIEPGNAAGVVRFAEPGSIARRVEQVRAAGGLVVVDEVTTGFGRTGTWFGWQHEGFTPDIVAIGKGCGNGYPVSAVVVSAEVAARLETTGLRYAQSHQNDPLGAAVVDAVISVIEDEDLLQRSHDRGVQLRDGLRRLEASGADVSQVRGRGLMCAFDVRTGAAHHVQAELVDRGYLVGANTVHHTIRLYPPLVITSEQVDGLLAAIGDSTASRRV